MNLESLRNVEVPEDDDTDRLASVRGRIRTAERRRAAALAGGTVAGFVAIAAVVLTSGVTHKAQQPPVNLQQSPSPAPSATPSATPAPSPSPGAIRNVQTFTTQWRALPAAPSMDGGGVGVGAYGVWTGQELVDTDAGCCEAPDSRTLAAYDPTTDAWRSLKPFPGVARAGAGTAAVGANTVYLVGGLVRDSHSNPVYQHDLWKLDLTSNTWTRLADLPVSGELESFTPVGLSIVAVVKGETSTTIVSYDYQADTWSGAFTAAKGAFVGSVAIAEGPSLFLFGGSTGTAATSSQLATYEPVTGTLTQLTAAPVQARQYATGVYAQSAHAIVVWGGATGGTKGATGGASYDVVTETWKTIAISPLTSGPVVRSAWTGSQMIVSSYDEPGKSTSASTSLAAYDPAADTWTPVAAPAGSSTDEGVFSHAFYSHLTWTGAQLLLTGGVPETRQGGGTLNFSLGSSGAASGADTTASDLTAAALTYTGLKAGQATLSEVTVSTIDPSWAAALITGNPDEGGPVQPARIGFHKVDGTWQAVNIGAAVLCNTTAPTAVITELTGATCK